MKVVTQWYSITQILMKMVARAQNFLRGATAPHPTSDPHPVTNMTTPADPPVPAPGTYPPDTHRQFEYLIPGQVLHAVRIEAGDP